ncbi:glutathione S-transferase [Thalassovita sp.]|uniref:glutathione S-transferase n=1 Tax=Thalassovita sp. TaxID=1979401 RepID=UPI0029DE68F5|nr:glutathione S-transferase [Thalassovita sp.]
MGYELFIADRAFSSWSLRGWLMFEKFGIPCKSNLIGLYDGTMQQDIAKLAPARLVPVMRTPDGVLIGETLAMAETLNEHHPDAQMWPADPAARGLARWMAAEMHAGFHALREHCAMQLLCQYKGFQPNTAVLADLDRLQTLWTLARTRHGADGPWLFGAYSLADVFYAPVAARIAGYGLQVGDLARDYVDTTLADPAFRRWRAMGLTKTYDPVPYALDLPKHRWPGPQPLSARAIDTGTAENAACPYSGKPVTDLAEIDGRVIGFCNPFCRDKTVHDPLAWPQVAALL